MRLFISRLNLCGVGSKKNWCEQEMDFVAEEKGEGGGVIDEKRLGDWYQEKLGVTLHRFNLVKALFWWRDVIKVSINSFPLNLSFQFSNFLVLSIYLSIYFSSIYLPSFHQFIYIVFNFHLAIHLVLSIYPTSCHLSIHIIFIYLSILFLSIYTSICHLCIYLFSSVYLSRFHLSI